MNSKSHNQNSNCLIFLVLALSLTGQASWAATDLDDDDIAPRQPGVITSVEAMQMGEQTANAYSVAAEYALSVGDTEQSIKLCRRAINKDMDDLDIHQIYAEALEKKIKKQPDRDPELFNECIKQWLMVLRSTVGDEKGLTNSNGIGLLTRFYEDDERGIPAKQHLLALTGSVPKAWESNAKYLKRVLKPGTTTVAGKVLKADASAATTKDTK